MPSTIAESDAYPATLQHPDAAELASAPGLLSQFGQGVANRLNWLKLRLDPLVTLVNGLKAGTTPFDALTATGAAVLNGGAQLAGNLWMPVTGYNIAPFRVASKPDSNQTIDRNTWTYCVPAGTGNFTWDIFGFAQRDGDWVGVRCNTVGNGTIKDPEGNTLMILSGSLPVVNLFAIRDSGTWRVVFTG